MRIPRLSHVDLRELKEYVAQHLDSNHPFRIAILLLPDVMKVEEFDGNLLLLLKLLRSKPARR
jgi:hypothetical protein